MPLFSAAALPHWLRAWPPSPHHYAPPGPLCREVEKVIRAPLESAPASTWILSLSSYLGFGGGQVWRSGAWIAYGDGGRIDRFEEGSGFRPNAFRQQRWGQPGDRVKSLLALPALAMNRGPRCVALVETGGTGDERRQSLLLWNGASWVNKVGGTWQILQLCD